jgi:DNA end-binding protein Ku
VQSVEALGVESAKIRDAELKLARQLIEQQSVESFDPAAYPDEVKARVEEAIQRKVEGKQFTVAEPRAEAKGNVVDLMSALKASLERGSGAKGPARASEPATTRRPPRRAPARASGPGRAHPRSRRKAAHS